MSLEIKSSSLERAAIVLKAPPESGEDLFLSDTYPGNQWFLAVLKRTYTVVIQCLQDTSDLQRTLKQALKSLGQNDRPVDVIIQAHGDEEGMDFGKEEFLLSHVTKKTKTFIQERHIAWQSNL